MRKIELLSPAKDFDAARAAVDHGADAVYMGGARFGARRAAANSIDEIMRAVEYAHQYGVRLHATLNTTLFDDELPEAESVARELIAAGADALIVQDMALRRMNLPVELHASTQVGNTTPEGVLFLEQCGFSRVILERALSLDEIRRIRQATNVELECFVHGAICVGHSGRCFLSRTTSTRSGNRGECSQPCRLPYDLVDGGGRKILSGKHLLSVRDLDLSEDLEQLIDAGISSFKIEGRLKDVRYIKNIVAYYRKCIDRIIARRDDVVRTSVGESVVEFEPNPAKSFTRGASQYMLHGRASGVASFNTPKAVGEYVGKISRITRKGFYLDSNHSLSAGDGVCVMGGGELLGSNVNGVESGMVQLNRMDGVAVGDKVYRNYDHQFTLQLDRSRTQRKIDVRAQVVLSQDGCAITLRDIEDVEMSISRSMVLQPAEDSVKMVETINRQMRKSGGTIFSVKEVEIVGSDYFIPVSILNELRREALDGLRMARLNKKLPQNIRPDDGTARYPFAMVSRYENVTNHLAEEFYRLHGVSNIEQPLEALSTHGQRVMISSYCIRREIGQCLKENPSLQGDLYIEHGAARYKLCFDCGRCLMMLEDNSIKNVKEKR